MTGTNNGPWAGVEPSGLRVGGGGPDPLPLGSCNRYGSSGELHLVRPGARAEGGSNGDLRRIARGRTGPPRWPSAPPAYHVRSKSRGRVIGPWVVSRNGNGCWRQSRNVPVTSGGEDGRMAMRLHDQIDLAHRSLDLDMTVCATIAPRSVDIWLRESRR